MLRIRNVLTGEIAYIGMDEIIPDEWESYPYTIHVTSDSPEWLPWFWLIIILVLSALALNKGKLWTR